MNLDMPTKRHDHSGDSFKHVFPSRTRLDQIESDACNTRLIQLLELGACSTGVDDCHASGRGAKCAQAGQHDAVVPAIARGLDNYIALEIEAALELAVVVR